MTRPAGNNSCARQQYGQTSIPCSPERVCHETQYLCRAAGLGHRWLRRPRRQQGPTASGVVGQAPAALGVQGQNIFDVKPDAKPSPLCRADNGERMKVQPGNNAPMWRQVGQGVTGCNSLPKTQAPEAGNLIQPFVQYPGSRVTNAGEAWRQVRNQWIIPYGAALFAIVLLALGIFYFTKGPLGHDHPEGPGTHAALNASFERAALGECLCLHCPGHFGHRDGVWQVLPAAHHGFHAVWLADLCPQNERAQLRGAAVCRVAAGDHPHVREGQHCQPPTSWAVRAAACWAAITRCHRTASTQGEKGLFWWGVTIPGIFGWAPGLVLDKLIPGFGDVRSDMQIAHMIACHLAIWMMALICGHIYMGTVG